MGRTCLHEAWKESVCLFLECIFIFFCVVFFFGFFVYDWVLYGIEAGLF